MRRGDVVGEDGGGELGLVPIVRAKRVGEPLAVEADLPRQQAALLEQAPSEFRDGGLVVARQGEQRETGRSGRAG